MALDLFFMIGYSCSISRTAQLFSHRLPLMAWAAGIGILLVLMADLAENLTMLGSLDLAQSGIDLDPARITMPVGAALFVSGALDQRLLGGLFILVGMGGGLGFPALVLFLRDRRGA